MSDIDNRTPSPPWGYSQPCDYDEQTQLHLVAEFTAHRIRPERIAYRTGIDIAFVRELLAGNAHARKFKQLLAHYRKHRRQQHLLEAEALKGTARFEQEQRVERDFQRVL